MLILDAATLLMPGFTPAGAALLKPNLSLHSGKPFTG
jgi:hypothetical protein